MLKSNQIFDDIEDFVAEEKVNDDKINKLNAKYNDSFNAKAGQSLEESLLNSSKNLSKTRKQMSDNIYTKGFIEENLNYNYKQNHKILDHTSYNPHEDLARDGEKFPFRKINEEVKKLGSTIEEFTFEEFLTKEDNVDGVNFDINANKLKLLNERSNLYTEFSDDDLDDLVDIALDPDASARDNENFEKFRTTLGLDILGDDIYPKKIEENSFIKKKGSADN